LSWRQIQRLRPRRYALPLFSWSDLATTKVSSLTPQVAGSWTVMILPAV
jgi:hypothetical protein